jgi:hypothetical protein
MSHSIDFFSYDQFFFIQSILIRYVIYDWWVGNTNGQQLHTKVPYDLALCCRSSGTPVFSPRPLPSRLWLCLLRPALLFYCPLDFLWPGQTNQTNWTALLRIWMFVRELDLFWVGKAKKQDLSNTYLDFVLPFTHRLSVFIILPHKLNIWMYWSRFIWEKISFAHLEFCLRESQSSKTTSISFRKL